jgi:hypothetical protein
MQGRVDGIYIAKSNYQVHRVCLSVRMEQLGPHRNNFNEIRYWRNLFENMLNIF